MGTYVVISVIIVAAVTVLALGVTGAFANLALRRPPASNRVTV
jgi:Flp pilus assembly pilin Flp